MKGEKAGSDRGGTRLTNLMNHDNDPSSSHSRMCGLGIKLENKYEYDK